MKEQILADDPIFEAGSLKVIRRRIRLSSGQEVEWQIIDKGWDSVAMVPVYPDGRVVLVEEYFGATDERSLCLPKGKIDPGEEAEDAALRELQEEVGLKGALELLSTVSLSPGYLTQRTHLFLATDLEPSQLEGDEVQFIQPRTLSLNEAYAMCLSGQISEARTVTGILLARDRLSR